MAEIDFYPDEEQPGWPTRRRRPADPGQFGDGDWQRQIPGSPETGEYTRPPSGPPPSTPPVLGTNPDTNRPTPPSPPQFGAPGAPPPSTPPVWGTNPDTNRPQRHTSVPRPPDTPEPPDTSGLPGAPTTPPQYSASAIEALKGFYRRYLGRDASQDEINKWLSGQYGWGDANNLSGIERGISWSDEARRRAITAGTPPTNTPWQHDYSAFNTAREQDPRKSAKDAFALYSNLAPPPPFQDKRALAQWFNQYIAPGMNSLGHRIISVSEDGFTYENHEGRFFVDFAQNAGAATGSMLQRLQWGARPADEATARRWNVGMDGNPVGSTGSRGSTASGWSGGPGGGGLFGVGLPGSQFSDPHTQTLENLLLSRINSIQTGNDEGLQRLMAYLNQRFNDLQGPGYTGAENEVINTRALEPIERDRSAARRRAIERLSARGITPDSGIGQQLLQEIDNQFDAMRSGAQSDLTMNELGRREGRFGRAEGIAGSMYEIPQARAREALGYAGALADLGPQRLRLAMQALGSGGSPESMFQNLMSLARLNQDSALLDSQNSGRWWSGLGQIAAILANAGR